MYPRVNNLIDVTAHQSASHNALIREEVEEEKEDEGTSPLAIGTALTSVGVA